MATGKMVKCDVCGKEFTERGIGRHKAVHMGEQSHQRREGKSERINAAMSALYPEGIPVGEIERATRVQRAITAALV